jgi:hypothetical protein
MGMPGDKSKDIYKIDRHLDCIEDMVWGDACMEHIEQGNPLSA